MEKILLFVAVVLLVVFGQEVLTAVLELLRQLSTANIW